MVPWIYVYPNIISDCYIGYLPAIFDVSLSILTCIVSFVLVSDGFHESVTTIRCLKQIFTDLLRKHRPPRKPPWIQHEEEDLETRGRSMISANQIFFKTDILLQYIWYQNICLKSWNASSKKHVVSLLYGDMLTIVENWSFQLLFLTVESIHWILNRRILIDLNWNETNVIQQRELIVQMRQRFQVRKNLSLIVLVILFGIFHYCICIYVICLQSN